MKKYCFYCLSLKCTVQSTNANKRYAIACLCRHLEVSPDSLVYIGANL